MHHSELLKGTRSSLLGGGLLGGDLLGGLLASLLDGLLGGSALGGLGDLLGGLLGGDFLGGSSTGTGYQRKSKVRLMFAKAWAHRQSRGRFTRGASSASRNRAQLPEPLSLSQARGELDQCSGKVGGRVC